MRQGACGGAGSRHSEVAAWRQLGSTGPEKDAEAGERDRDFERARELRRIEGEEKYTC